MEARQLQDKNVDILTATIAQSATESDAVILYGTTAIGITMPLSITGTALSFTGSMDKGVTFVDIKDAFDSLVSYTVSADSGYSLDANIFAPYDQIKLTMDAQSAEIEVLVKPFAV